MILFSKTPFELAWGNVKKEETDIFGCPDCEMPISQNFQKSNIRMVGEDRILSCPWCYQVYNIGPKEILPLYC